MPGKGNDARTRELKRKKAREDQMKEDAKTRQVHELLLSTLPKGWKVTKRPPDPGEKLRAVRRTNSN